MRWIRIALTIGTLLGASGVRAAGTVLPPLIFRSASTPHPEVALTFDDGPSPFTPQVLSILRRFHARATFFLVGLHIARFPATVRAEVAQGDRIGNHTYTHADLEWLSNGAVLAQLQQTQVAARAAAGATPRWFRPPYGAVDTRVAALAAAAGLRTVTWSVDPADWSRPGVSLIVQRVLAATRPGSVILLHDGGGDRSETVAALPGILTTLRSRGYRFVTLHTLFLPRAHHRTVAAADRITPSRYRQRTRTRLPRALAGECRQRYSTCSRST